MQGPPSQSQLPRRACRKDEKLRGGCKGTHRRGEKPDELLPKLQVNSGAGGCAITCTAAAQWRPTTQRREALDVRASRRSLLTPRPLCFSYSAGPDRPKQFRLLLFITILDKLYVTIQRQSQDLQRLFHESMANLILMGRAVEIVRKS